MMERSDRIEIRLCYPDEDDPRVHISTVEGPEGGLDDIDLAQVLLQAYGNRAFEAVVNVLVYLDQWDESGSDRDMPEHLVEAAEEYLDRVKARMKHLYDKD